MKFSVTFLVGVAVFLLLLELCHCDDIDRTFFKKKKEKKKEKKPSYKPSYNDRTFHKKNKEKAKKPSYRPSYHPPPSYHPGPTHGGHIPFPIRATRHFGAAVVGPSHSWPRPPHFGPFGYRQNFPY